MADETTEPVHPGPILEPEVEHDLLPGERMKGAEVVSNDPNVRITLESGVYHWQPTTPSGGIARIHPGIPSQEQLAAWYADQQAREELAKSSGGPAGSVEQFSAGKDGSIQAKTASAPSLPPPAKA